MKKKILFVVTSHSRLGETGKPTGYHLGEVTHPWSVLKDAGFTIDFVSPQGGQAPAVHLDFIDSINKEFWEDETYRNKMDHSMKPSEVDPDDYCAIYFAGGHGAMWDLPNDSSIEQIARQIYENNGIIGAVCHGPAGLVNLKLNNGKYLVEGKKINSFTNEEEEAALMDEVVPFLLESRLTERGGLFEKSEMGKAHVVSDQRLVTGQNPKSAKGVGEAMLAAIREIPQSRTL